ncbi:tRNA (adenosine(37)-N6)-threonylcarbamoyltransferase complex ATPase subunit type 1 TsaE [Beijerinckia mobilis]|uniref:tRNA (adenosine(37)-N6)-threonylcarbamoyltransferase complex ATPase subunit type 1 TsaE n=1 Tax=Beijerinckia mobilis TaxID=231434 RepID=UPI000550F2B3|nr:tRNA (adenosine(37)-N6)-threonylcarbamoyltransferase complex ATPase subunit type 1 TsaE [Beijerinckia mobilis]
MSELASDTGRMNLETSIWQRDLAGEAATAALAADIAPLLGPGDLVTLSGDLGSGKTSFARALIRVLTGDPTLEVPSPTFTLLQLYDGERCPIVHADLYRINRPEELADLGWDEAGEGAIVLVEWPDHAREILSSDRLDIAFRLDPSQPPTYRAATLTGFGAMAERLANARALKTLLERSGWQSAERHFLTGDASNRLYERLIKPNGDRALLMISPPRPDGPPIRYGKSYSTIAKLAETIHPFLALSEGLRAHGFSAPAIFATDPNAGLAVIEDLGGELIVEGREIIQERYAWAATALAALHVTPLPDTLSAPDGKGGEIPYPIPLYDIDALAIEIELFVDWYAPFIAGVHLASGAKASFVNLWRHALQEVSARPSAMANLTWTLRDYHSPNILWLPEREGIGRVGMLDFQDCVLGHPAYDLASLLQDARVTVPDDVEIKLLGHYLRFRRERDAAFDISSFARAYALLGAQRATKILGIFARLDRRDHKPAYLTHLPRVHTYLLKGLAHPALADIKLWYETYMPAMLNPLVAGR